MTMEYYEGRTAVMAGATSGMGFLAAKTIAEVGGNVVMCDFNAEGSRPRRTR